ESLRGLRQQGGALPRSTRVLRKDHWAANLGQGRRGRHGPRGHAESVDGGNREPSRIAGGARRLPWGVGSGRRRVAGRDRRGSQKLPNGESTDPAVAATD